MTPIADVQELSPEQRRKVVAFYKAHPGAGYKRALQHVGIRAMWREAKAFLLADEVVREARFAAMGVSEHTVLTTLGEMIADETHKDRFNATKLAMGVLHGFHERSGVDVDVQHGGNVVVEHERRLTLGDLANFARTVDGSGGGPVGELSRAREVLPASADDQPAAG
jgi:hypothetical protein